MKQKSRTRRGTAGETIKSAAGNLHGLRHRRLIGRKRNSPEIENKNPMMDGCIACFVPPMQAVIYNFLKKWLSMSFFLSWSARFSVGQNGAVAGRRMIT
ncbi:MAG: hypothetical protein HQL63_10345 [Magnetococcales bacterium]|nr:hypothetical protein [Magnetococcales bacterium]MBF0321885.1 hypothetical protein [Magnetococcales bacterium]